MRGEAMHCVAVDHDATWGFTYRCLVSQQDAIP
jgi:hypothetical protein